MSNYNDFSFLETIAIEIGPKCNLQHLHKNCPINYRHKTNNEMSVDQVVEIIDQAIGLNFKGHFAFHFYNEPLLYASKIKDIQKLRPNVKYLLWTNGTLIEKLLLEGYDFNIFDKIVITRYKGIKDEGFFRLKDTHNNVQIFDEDMDDRVHFYESEKENYFACKKMYIELPIDCDGNVYVCTYDWNQKYLLGNVFDQSLDTVLKSELYQKLLKGNEKRFRHVDNIINLCRYCPRPYTNRK